MKVSRASRNSTPGYPTFRQVSESRLLAGLASLGLSAMTGMGGAPGGTERELSVPGDLAVLPTPPPVAQATNAVTCALPGGARKLPGEPLPVAATNAATSNASCRVTYRVKAGDSLISIAREQLGKPGRWTEIVNLNPGLTPATLKAGQLIYLPHKLPPP